MIMVCSFLKDVEILVLENGKGCFGGNRYIPPVTLNVHIVFYYSGIC